MFSSNTIVATLLVLLISTFCFSINVSAIDASKNSDGIKIETDKFVLDITETSNYHPRFTFDKDASKDNSTFEYRMEVSKIRQIDSNGDKVGNSYLGNSWTFNQPQEDGSTAMANITNSPGPTFTYDFVASDGDTSFTMTTKVEGLSWETNAEKLEICYKLTDLDGDKVDVSSSENTFDLGNAEIEFDNTAEVGSENTTQVTSSNTDNEICVKYAKWDETEMLTHEATVNVQMGSSSGSDTGGGKSESGKQSSSGEESNANTIKNTINVTAMIAMTLLSFALYFF